MEIDIFNFLSPVSTRAVGNFNVLLVGGPNRDLPLQQELGKVISVTSVSPPKSLDLQKSNMLTLSTTSLIFQIQSQSVFGTNFELSLILPNEFILSSFFTSLVGYTFDGLPVVIRMINTNQIVVSSNLLKSNTSDMMYLRLEGVKNYAGARVSASKFIVTIYDDPSMGNKVHEDMTSLGYETLVNRLGVSSLNFSPTTVQVASDYSFGLQLYDGMDSSSGNSYRLSITLPPQLAFNSQLTSKMIGKGQILCSGIMDFIAWTFQPQNALCELQQKELLTIYGFFSKSMNNSFDLNLKQLINPISSQLTAPFLLEVDMQTSGSSLTWLNLYKNSQIETTTAITATPGDITVLRLEITGSSVTFEVSQYLVSFKLSSLLAPLSLIVLYFPVDDFQFLPATIANGSCSFSQGLSTYKTPCQFLDNNTVEFTLLENQQLAPGAVITVMLNGIQNPRSIRPTLPITISSYPPLRGGIIDQTTSTYNMGLTVNRPATLVVNSIQPASFIIGDITTYTLTFQSPTLLKPGDQLIVNFGDITIQTLEPTCSGIQGFLQQIPCTSDGINKLSATITTILPAISVIQLSVSNLRNPFAALTSTPLFLQIRDSQDYMVVQATFSNVAKKPDGRGFDPAMIGSLNITPESTQVGQTTTYTFGFILPIPVKTNFVFIITLASEIGVGADALGSFFLVKGISPPVRARCEYIMSSRQIIISDFILPLIRLRSLAGSPNDIPMGSSIQISVTGIQNKQTNGPFQSSASSMMDVSLAIQDALSNSYLNLAVAQIHLSPIFKCSNVCENCRGSDSNCTSCPSKSFFLLQDQTCASQCPLLYALQEATSTSNATCMRCTAQNIDPFCTACSSSDLAGCIQCAPKYKLVISAPHLTTGICEMITSNNDPLRAFVYDFDYNLPFISTFIILVTAFLIIRRIWIVQTLCLTVLLLIAYSFIETLVLLIFLAKVLLLEEISLTIAATILFSSYIIIQVIFSRKFYKSLGEDGSFMLYSPSYQTIRVIAKFSFLNNYKSFLLYRSRFSIIKDIYNIPFTNSHQHVYIMRKGLQFSLIFTIIFLLFNIRVMQFTYSYRQIPIPPFFFIELELLYIVIALFMSIILYSKSSCGLNCFLDASDQIVPKYKLSHLDITEKTPSGTVKPPNDHPSLIYNPENSANNTQMYTSHLIKQMHSNVNIRRSNPQIPKPTTPNSQRIGSPILDERSLSNCSSTQDLKVLPRFSHSPAILHPPTEIQSQIRLNHQLMDRQFFQSNEFNERQSIEGERLQIHPVESLVCSQSEPISKQQSIGKILNHPQPDPSNCHENNSHIFNTFQSDQKQIASKCVPNFTQNRPHQFQNGFPPQNTFDIKDTNQKSFHQSKLVQKSLPIDKLNVESDNKLCLSSNISQISSQKYTESSMNDDITNSFIFKQGDRMADIKDDNNEFQKKTIPSPKLYATPQIGKHSFEMDPPNNNYLDPTQKNPVPQFMKLNQQNEPSQTPPTNPNNNQIPPQLYSFSSNRQACIQPSQTVSKFNHNSTEENNIYDHPDSEQNPNLFPPYVENPPLAVKLSEQEQFQNPQTQSKIANKFLNIYASANPLQSIDSRQSDYFPVYQE